MASHFDASEGRTSAKGSKEPLKRGWENELAAQNAADKPERELVELSALDRVGVGRVGNGGHNANVNGGGAEGKGDDEREGGDVSDLGASPSDRRLAEGDDNSRLPDTTPDSIDREAGEERNGGPPVLLGRGEGQDGFNCSRFQVTVFDQT